MQRKVHPYHTKSKFHDAQRYFYPKTMREIVMIKDELTNVGHKVPSGIRFNTNRFATSNLSR